MLQTSRAEISDKIYRELFGLRYKKEVSLSMKRCAIGEVIIHGFSDDAPDLTRGEIAKRIMIKFEQDPEILSKLALSVMEHYADKARQALSSESPVRALIAFEHYFKKANKVLDSMLPEDDDFLNDDCFGELPSNNNRQVALDVLNNSVSYETPRWNLVHLVRRYNINLSNNPEILADLYVPLHSLGQKFANEMIDLVDLQDYEYIEGENI